MALAVVFLTYGYLCRLAGIYFFWESKSIGWAIFFIGIIALLADSIKNKAVKEKKAIPEKIGIGIIVFVLLIQLILIIAIRFSDAYSTAKTFVSHEPAIQSELGNLTGFSLMPFGSIHVMTGSDGTSGEAAISLTIKGEKKFSDATVYLVKYPGEENWQVTGIE